MAILYCNRQIQIHQYSCNSDFGLTNLIPTNISGYIVPKFIWQVALASIKFGEMALHWYTTHYRHAYIKLIWQIFIILAISTKFTPNRQIKKKNIDT